MGFGNSYKNICISDESAAVDRGREMKYNKQEGEKQASKRGEHIYEV